jgi:hypothetical protein
MNDEEKEEIVCEDIKKLIDKWKIMDFNSLMCCEISMCIFLSGIINLEERGLIDTDEFVEKCLIRTKCAMAAKDKRKNE